MSNFLLKITIFVLAGVALSACGGVTSTTESFAESPTLLPDPTYVPDPSDVPEPTDVPGDMIVQHPALNCQDLFLDAVEISAQNYLNNLEESWFSVRNNEK